MVFTLSRSVSCLIWQCSDPLRSILYVFWWFCVISHKCQFDTMQHSWRLSACVVRKRFWVKQTLGLPSEGSWASERALACENRTRIWRFPIISLRGWFRPGKWRKWGRCAAGTAVTRPGKIRGQHSHRGSKTNQNPWTFSPLTPPYSCTSPLLKPKE